MFDLFSIGVLGLTTLGLVSAESILSADTVRTEVHVSAGLQASGYHDKIVTDYFDHELRRIFDANSIIVKPRIRVAATPSVVSVIANSIGLQGIRQSVQDMIGLDPVVIKLAVQPGPEARPLIHIFGRLSETQIFDLTVNAVPGNVRETIRAAAFETAMALDPYQPILDLTREALQRRAIFVKRLQREKKISLLMSYREHNELNGSELEALIARSLVIFDSSTTADRLRLIPLLNLVGILSFNLEKFDEAERFFRLAYEGNRSLVTPRLNIATIKLLRGQNDEAAGLLRAVQADFAKGVGNPGAKRLFEATSLVLQAFIAKRTNNADLLTLSWRNLCKLNPRMGFLAFYQEPRWAPYVPIPDCEALLASWRRGANDDNEDTVFGADDDISAESLIMSTFFRSAF
jgi:hypothetical protein